MAGHDQDALAVNFHGKQLSLDDAAAAGVIVKAIAAVPGLRRIQLDGNTFGLAACQVNRLTLVGFLLLMPYNAAIN